MPEQQIYKAWIPDEKQLPVSELPMHGMGCAGQDREERKPHISNVKEHGYLVLIRISIIKSIPSLGGAQALIGQSEAKREQPPGPTFNFSSSCLHPKC